MPYSCCVFSWKENVGDMLIPSTRELEKPHALSVTVWTLRLSCVSRWHLSSYYSLMGFPWRTSVSLPCHLQGFFHPEFTWARTVKNLPLLFDGAHIPEQKDHVSISQEDRPPQGSRREEKTFLKCGRNIIYNQFFKDKQLISFVAQQVTFVSIPMPS